MRWSIIIIFVCTMLSACSPANGEDIRRENEKVKTNFMNEVTNQLNQGELSNYVSTGLEVDDVESILRGDTTHYGFKLTGKLNKEFESLTEREQYEILKEFDSKSFTKTFDDEQIDYSCEMDSITLSTPSDTFKVSRATSFIIQKNNLYFSPTPTVTAYKILDQVDDSEIYSYMKDQYDKLTNFGENYDPKYHDLLVAEKAAVKFSITAEEAAEIYINYQIRQK
ncbi:hypothetical protein [Halobacillus sp. BBL2006]|uniref:hypothetical protein n=1 Tax=Halobacillus sp. BBL2006 TaxID=1543706 RepID=UPI000542BF3D|nr:hypothetical protein [Halobacillus sp. BBL2006]KHE72470.1 hypothetical protein LD39_04390 [Halobacillus sp. BBL2006]